MEALELFKPGEKGKDIIRVSHGPQFRAGGGVVLFMFFLLTFLLFIIGMAQGEPTFALFCLAISAGLFSWVIDIHGIEVNKKTHQIKEYKAFLWFRIGEGKNINDFKALYLKQENVTTRTAGYAGSKGDTYFYYKIKLVDEINRLEIYLAEYQNYYKAQKISQYIADLTGIEFKDYVKGTKTRTATREIHN